MEEMLATYIEETAAYVRVSKEEKLKKNGLSIEAQKQKLAEFAEKNNLKIVEWYIDDGVSGRKPIARRPQLQRMIHDAQKGHFKRVIFIKLDRYFRSVQEYYACQAMLDKTGVTWTATEEKYSLADANGRAFVNMKLTIAELEADTTGERIKIVNDYKVKSGMPLYGSQCLPFCYAVGGGEKQKSIVKQNQEIMEDAIEQIMVNKSICGALKYINTKYDIQLNYKQLRNTLSNEMICGSYRGNPNYCPAYITREMFDKLQVIVNRNPRTSQNEYSYILTGLIRCPNCGGTLKGTYNISKGSRYHGYRCDKALRDKSCSFRMFIFESTMERSLINRVEEILEAQEIKNIEISKKEHVVSKYNVNELRAELERLNYSWQKGRIKSVEEYDKKYDEIVAKIAEAESTVPEEPTDFTHIKEILSGGWKSIYEALDNDHKKAFWRSFVKEIKIDWSKEHKEITDIIFF